MATLYWYGGTGNWSDGVTHWSTNSGNSPSATHVSPTAADDAIFDANSGVGTMTFLGTDVCRNLDFSASSITTIAGSVAVTVSGNLTLKAGLTHSSFTGGVVMNQASGTALITPNTLVTSFNVNMNAAATTFRLVGNWSVAGNVTLTAGTFDGVTNTTTVTQTTLRSFYNTAGTFNFYNLTRAPASPAPTDTLVFSGNFTIANTLTINEGAAGVNRCLCSSFTEGTQYTITAGALSVNNTDIRDLQFQTATARTITGVTDNGSGKARFATSSAHGLIVGAVLMVSGTTNYNGTTTVTAVSDGTHFDASAVSYVSSQAGIWKFDLKTITGNAGDCGNNLGIDFLTPTRNIGQTLRVVPGQHRPIGLLEFL